jgi:hypothetical protein
MLNKNPSSKRRILSATLLLTLLISALTATLLINDATANPVGYYYPWSPPPAPIVKVIELNTDKLILTFSAVKNGTWITPYGMGADYQPSHEWSYFIFSKVYVDGKLWSSHDLGTSFIRVSLEGLSNGLHTVEVTATAKYGNYGYASTVSSGVIEFLVDAPPPSISVITGQKTFEPSSSTADVPLNFTVNKPVSWIGYSLNGDNAVTVTNDLASTKWFGTVNYQLVLSCVPAGEHSLTVYAEDTVGNRGESEPFTFTVTQETPSETKQASPFPTALATVGISTAVVAVSSGLLLYFKKRKR